MLTARVYGVYINEKRQVLVSDELIRGEIYCKFPGGGLEFGEGTKECLKREFKEELSQDILVKEHIYTSDFFVESAFATGTQVISIYYLVDFLLPVTITSSNSKPSMENFVYNNPKQSERHRLLDWSDFVETAFDLPIDKVVVDIIREKYF